MNTEVDYYFSINSKIIDIVLQQATPPLYAPWPLCKIHKYVFNLFFCILKIKIYLVG